MKKTTNEGVSGFQWEDNSDLQRIKNNSEKYKEVDVAEAFADYYHFKLKKNHSITAPPEFKIGEYVDLTILSVNRKQVIFEQTNFKEEVVCACNLAQYPKFRDMTQPITLPCRVVEKSDTKVMVDPLYIFYDNFIKEYVKDLSYQYNIKERFQPFTARNLQLVRGGFMGSLRMDKASDWLGKDLFLEVFIPGSQIVVNVEEDFEKWTGKNVPMYIINLIEKPGTDNKVIVGSPKEYYKLNARLELMDVFNHYCLDDDQWKKLQKEPIDGKITGVIHTQNKCGVFVQVGHQTGLIECEPELLMNFHKGDTIKVVYKGFNELMTYNSMVDQMQHIEPYIIQDGILKRFNLKVIFGLA